MTDPAPVDPYGTCLGIDLLHTEHIHQLFDGETGYMTKLHESIRVHLNKLHQSRLDLAASASGTLLDPRPFAGVTSTSLPISSSALSSANGTDTVASEMSDTQDARKPSNPAAVVRLDVATRVSSQSQTSGEDSDKSSDESDLDLELKLGSGFVQIEDEPYTGGVSACPLSEDDITPAATSPAVLSDTLLFGSSDHSTVMMDDHHNHNDISDDDENKMNELRPTLTADDSSCSAIGTWMRTSRRRRGVMDSSAATVTAGSSSIISSSSNSSSSMSNISERESEERQERVSPPLRSFVISDDMLVESEERGSSESDNRCSKISAQQKTTIAAATMTTAMVVGVPRLSSNQGNGSLAERDGIGTSLITEGLDVESSMLMDDSLLIERDLDCDERVIDELVSELQDRTSASAGPSIPALTPLVISMGSDDCVAVPMIRDPSLMDSSGESDVDISSDTDYVDEDEDDDRNHQTRDGLNPGLMTTTTSTTDLRVTPAAVIHTRVVRRDLDGINGEMNDQRRSSVVDTPEDEDRDVVTDHSLNLRTHQLSNQRTVGSTPGSTVTPPPTFSAIGGRSFLSDISDSCRSDTQNTTSTVRLASVLGEEFSRKTLVLDVDNTIIHVKHFMDEMCVGDLVHFGHRNAKVTKMYYRMELELMHKRRSLIYDHCITSMDQQVPKRGGWYPNDYQRTGRILQIEPVGCEIVMLPEDRSVVLKAMVEENLKCTTDARPMVNTTSLSHRSSGTSTQPTTLTTTGSSGGSHPAPFMMKHPVLGSNSLTPATSESSEHSSSNNEFDESADDLDDLNPFPVCDPILESKRSDSLSRYEEMMARLSTRGAGSSTIPHTSGTPVSTPRVVRIGDSSRMTVTPLSKAMPSPSLSITPRKTTWFSFPSSSSTNSSRATTPRGKGGASSSSTVISLLDEEDVTDKLVIMNSSSSSSSSTSTTMNSRRLPPIPTLRRVSSVPTLTAHHFDLNEITANPWNSMSNLDQFQSEPESLFISFHENSDELNKLDPFVDRSGSLPVDLMYGGYIVRFRPGLLDFLLEVTKDFEVILFTAADGAVYRGLLKEVHSTLIEKLKERLSMAPGFAEKSEQIEQTKFWRQVYYRSDCDDRIMENGMYKHKNASKLGRDFANLVLIDDNPMSFRGFNPNFIRIRSFWGLADPVDNELVRNILPMLRDVSKHCDVRYKLTNLARVPPYDVQKLCEEHRRKGHRTMVDSIEQTNMFLRYLANAAERRRMELEKQAQQYYMHQYYGHLGSIDPGRSTPVTETSSTCGTADETGTAGEAATMTSAAAAAVAAHSHAHAASAVFPPPPTIVKSLSTSSAARHTAKSSHVMQDRPRLMQSNSHPTPGSTSTHPSTVHIHAHHHHHHPTSAVAASAAAAATPAALMIAGSVSRSASTGALPQPHSAVAPTMQVPAFATQCSIPGSAAVAAVPGYQHHPHHYHQGYYPTHPHQIHQYSTAATSPVYAGHHQGYPVAAQPYAAHHTAGVGSSFHHQSQSSQFQWQSAAVAAAAAEARRKEQLQIHSILQAQRQAADLRRQRQKWLMAHRKHSDSLLMEGMGMSMLREDHSDPTPSYYSGTSSAGITAQSSDDLVRTMTAPFTSGCNPYSPSFVPRRPSAHALRAKSMPVLLKSRQEFETIYEHSLEGSMEAESSTAPSGIAAALAAKQSVPGGTAVTGGSSSGVTASYSDPECAAFSGISVKNPHFSALAVRVGSDSPGSRSDCSMTATPRSSGIKLGSSLSSTTSSTPSLHATPAGGYATPKSALTSRSGSMGKPVGSTMSPLTGLSRTGLRRGSVNSSTSISSGIGLVSRGGGLAYPNPYHAHQQPYHGRSSAMGPIVYQSLRKPSDGSDFSAGSME